MRFQEGFKEIVGSSNEIIDRLRINHRKKFHDLIAFLRDDRDHCEDDNGEDGIENGEHD